MSGVKNLFDTIKGLVTGQRHTETLSFSDLGQVGSRIAFQEKARALDSRIASFEETIRVFGSNATKSLILTYEELLDQKRQMQRSISAGVFTEGGATVEGRVGNVIDLLRPKSVVMQAGAQLQIIDPAGTAFPQITTGASAQWLSELGEASVSSAAFSQLKPSPKRCTAILRVSRQLLVQAPELAESTLRRDLFGAVGGAIDIASLSGLGNAEPLGILFNEQIPAPVTFGGAANLDDITILEEEVAEAFAEREMGMAFVTSTGARRKMRQIEAITGSGNPLWDNDNRVIGCPAYASKTVVTDQMIYGYWPDWCVFMFGGVSLLVDKFTQAKSDQVDIMVTGFADCGALRPKSFALSTDSAAQP